MNKNSAEGSQVSEEGGMHRRDLLRSAAGAFAGLSVFALLGGEEAEAGKKGKKKKLSKEEKAELKQGYSIEVDDVPNGESRLHRKQHHTGPAFFSKTEKQAEQHIASTYPSQTYATVDCMPTACPCGCRQAIQEQHYVLCGPNVLGNGCPQRPGRFVRYRSRRPIAYNSHGINMPGGTNRRFPFPSSVYNNLRAPAPRYPWRR